MKSVKITFVKTQSLIIALDAAVPGSLIRPPSVTLGSCCCYQHPAEPSGCRPRPLLAPTSLRPCTHPREPPEVRPGCKTEKKCDVQDRWFHAQKHLVWMGVGRLLLMFANIGPEHFALQVERAMLLVYFKQVLVPLE